MYVGNRLTFQVVRDCLNSDWWFKFYGMVWILRDGSSSEGPLSFEEWFKFCWISLFSLMELDSVSSNSTKENKDIKWEEGWFRFWRMIQLWGMVQLVRVVIIHLPYIAVTIFLIFSQSCGHHQPCSQDVGVQWGEGDCCQEGRGGGRRGGRGATHREGVVCVHPQWAAQGDIWSGECLAVELDHLEDKY